MSLTMIWWPIAVSLVLGVPSSSSDIDAQSRRARSAYAKGRFSAAASIYDDLWRERHVADHLYNAAFAYEAAGRDLRALARFVRYAHLEGIAETDRLDVLARIARLHETLEPVVLAVKPGALAACARVEVRDIEGETTVFDVGLLPSAAGGGGGKRLSSGAAEPTCVDSSGPNPESSEHTLHLPPGRWLVRLVLPDTASMFFGAAAEEDIVVAPSSEATQQRVSFDLPRERASVHFTNIGSERSFFRPVDLTFEDRLGAHPPFTHSTQEPTLDVELPSGPWRVTIATRGRKRSARSQDIELHPEEEQTVDLAAHRVPSSPPRADSRKSPRALAISLGSAGLLLSGAGAALVGIGANGIEGKRVENTGFGAGINDDVMALCVGAGILGAGVGSATTAVVAAVKPRPRTWIAQLGIGSALLAFGAVGHGLALAEYESTGGAPADEVNNIDVPEYAIDDQAPWMTASALLFGVGVGLSVGATAALIERRRRRPRGFAGLTRSTVTGLEIRF